LTACSLNARSWRVSIATYQSFAVVAASDWRAYA
jgi:hypothetical protein